MYTLYMVNNGYCTLTVLMLTKLCYLWSVDLSIYPLPQLVLFALSIFVSSTNHLPNVIGPDSTKHGSKYAHCVFAGGNNCYVVPRLD